MYAGLVFRKPSRGSGSASASATTGLSTFSANARTSYCSFFCSSDIVKLMVTRTSFSRDEEVALVRLLRRRATPGTSLGRPRSAAEALRHGRHDIGHERRGPAQNGFRAGRAI